MPDLFLMLYGLLSFCNTPMGLIHSRQSVLCSLQVKTHSSPSLMSSYVQGISRPFNEGDEWVLTCREQRTDWREWIKTIGVLQNDKSPYSIKYKSGIYTFSVSETPAAGLEVRTADLHTKECKSFIKMLKQVFRKAACCVMCRVCEADCPYGCLSMKDGRVHISDKCHHCSRCHKPLMGCHVYHSLKKRRGGRMYFMRHGRKDADKDA